MAAVIDDEKDNFDLSELRGTAATLENKGIAGGNEDDDLNALSELVPDLKNRKRCPSMEHNSVMTMEDNQQGVSPAAAAAAAAGGGGEGEEVEIVNTTSPDNNNNNNNNISTAEQQQSDPTTATATTTKKSTSAAKKESFVADDDSSSDEFCENIKDDDVNNALYSGNVADLNNSDRALSSDDQDKSSQQGNNNAAKNINNDNDNLGLGDFNNISSAQSLSTATQTHEVRMPMYLPTFKPATGCTNASDFIVRCFVARLRSGITVVKHGRSRWCKSRLRILHIHPDGRSLSWKPAQGEPHSSKRPPKLDLTTCEEVRHAWSPDPQNPMYTGTPILRQKCEAANAHKSFALIFPKRTVDITSVTADQCKVLMEGFSALCFRLQVANLAGKGNKKGAQRMPEEEDHVSTTASATLTNNSNQIATSPHNRR
jgi:hypothetical protein